MTKLCSCGHDCMIETDLMMSLNDDRFDLVERE